MLLIPSYQKYLTDIGISFVRCSRNREKKEKPNILHNYPNIHLSFSFVAYCILYNNVALRAYFFVIYTKKKEVTKGKERVTPKRNGETHQYMESTIPVKKTTFTFDYKDIILQKEPFSPLFQVTRGIRHDPYVPFFILPIRVHPIGKFYPITHDRFLFS
ncbi:hypothetical protein BLX06_13645 [Bacillus cereus]|uniref:Uncharacterized protein n=1 Tax=Bacillus cereus TaxID=1396 RepID=A0A9X6BBK8_BACCE|nr:hypothetical protein BLX06_13645 [Bacillus cereus]